MWFPPAGILSAQPESSGRSELRAPTSWPETAIMHVLYYLTNSTQKITRPPPPPQTSEAKEVVGAPSGLGRCAGRAEKITLPPMSEKLGADVIGKGRKKRRGKRSETEQAWPSSRTGHELIAGHQGTQLSGRKERSGRASRHT